MKVLAFDCSTASGSVAVVADGVTIYDERFECPRGRGGAFFPALDRAVSAAGRVDRIAVGIGPGSYNGLRAAIAAAEGLHLVTGAERVGIVSPRALAGGEGEFFALGDARGGVFWLARVAGGRIEDDFELLPLADLLARVDARPDLRRLAAGPLPTVPGVTVAAPEAAVLARLALEEEPATSGIEPLYLKPAHITAPRPRS
jgi:tRNA threonylcarbamoyl adenosine modification protein YeaZ